MVSEFAVPALLSLEDVIAIQQMAIADLGDVDLKLAGLSKTFVWRAITAVPCNATRPLHDRSCLIASGWDLWAPVPGYLLQGLEFENA